MKPGRNDKCPCGSGKKVKKCDCGLRPPSQSRGSTPKPERVMATLSVHSPDRERRALPRNAVEFEAYMRRMDDDFSSRGVPIAGRPIAALVEVARDEGLEEGKFMPAESTHEVTTFEGDDLRRRVGSWFENRYGDRLRVNLGLGPTVVFIRGAFWEYRWPSVTGRPLFFARDLVNGPAMFLRARSIHWLLPGHILRSDNTLRPVDVLNGVVGFPPAVIPDLNDAELRTVVELFYADWQSMHWMQRARHHELVSSAQADFAAAVRHLLATPPELGQARWSTQQGIEKTYKAFLKSTGTNYPTRGSDAHDLVKLSRLAIAHGAVSFPDELIRQLSCKPGIRYGEIDPGEPELVLRLYKLGLLVAGAAAAILAQKHPVRAPRVTGGSPDDGFEWARDILDLMWERSGVPNKGFKKD